VANESFALEIQNDDEGRFRERLFALHQFERAWTLLQGRTHQNDLRIVVRLMQGLCAAEITGGASYALPRLRESRDKKRQRPIKHAKKLGSYGRELGILPTVVSPGAIWAQVEPGLESEALLANCALS
jgi:hypothetical protein